jgi:hypothetical protein
MTHCQEIQGFPDTSQVSLHDDNEIKLPIAVLARKWELTFVFRFISECAVYVFMLLKVSHNRMLNYMFKISFCVLKNSYTNASEEQEHTSFISRDGVVPTQHSYTTRRLHCTTVQKTTM